MHGCIPVIAKRILIKGDAEVTKESQTVGPADEPMAVHLALLNADVILLEGIRLADVSEGVYFLNAAALNLSGADGSPCRAILIA